MRSAASIAGRIKVTRTETIMSFGSLVLVVRPGHKSGNEVEISSIVVPPAPANARREYSILSRHISLANIASSGQACCASIVHQRRIASHHHFHALAGERRASPARKAGCSRVKPALPKRMTHLHAKPDQFSDLENGATGNASVDAAFLGRTPRQSQCHRHFPDGGEVLPVPPGIEPASMSSNDDLSRRAGSASRH